MDWRERVWGYTGGGGLVIALATGYFAWDLLMSATHVGIFGWGLLAHALSALSVYSLGFVSLPLQFSLPVLRDSRMFFTVTNDVLLLFAPCGQCFSWTNP